MARGGAAGNGRRGVRQQPVIDEENADAWFEAGFALHLTNNTKMHTLRLSQRIVRHKF